jgi:hypothetical protein
MVYKGTTYTECTTADNDQPWCETVASTSAGMKWGNCDCKNAPSVAAPSSDTLLTSYWDYGVCGPHGDDHNSDWCKDSVQQFPSFVQGAGDILEVSKRQGQLCESSGKWQSARATLPCKLGQHKYRWMRLRILCPV